MKIPPGYTEERVLQAIEKAADILAPSFVFGSYDVDDIRQQCFLFAFEVLEKEKFDPGRPLENFIYTHLRNQLINFRRNKFRRNDPPCGSCHSGVPCPKAEGEHCRKYRAWLRLNNAKANISSPLALDNVCDEKERRTRVESSSEQDVEIDELIKLVDSQLPVELRATYLQMRAGVSVPKPKRLQVERAVTEILKGTIESCPSADD